MSEVTSNQPRNITRIVARNSFWYALEQVFSFLAGFAASIAMARVIGPTRLGYFNYVMWLVNMTGLIGNLGIPATTRKYIAEYLGREEPGTARAIFNYTLRFQIRTSLVVTTLCLAAVHLFGDLEYRWISTFLVASMLPNLILSIPSQANVAREDYAANVPASVVAQVLYVSFVFVSLWLGWDLMGIAIGIFVYRWVELIVRLVPVLRWMRSMPKVPLATELRQRMRKFSNQGMLVMILNIIVWNRSDIIFLKYLTTDLAQISFYSVGFNLTEKILVLGRVFGASSGASLMAQYGRDKTKMLNLVTGSTQYMFQLMTPMLVGLAALSAAVIPALYGREYLPAIIPLSIVSSLAVLGAVVLPPRQLLQATERQSFLIWSTTLAAVVNIALDLWLVPRTGAIGAAIGNGVAQLVAAVAIWWRAITWFDIKMPWAALSKTTAIVTAMGIIVWGIGKTLPTWPAIIIGTLAGAVIYLLGLRWTRALNQTDYARLRQMIPNKLGPARPWAFKVLRFVVPA